jgi:hypothetical protein
MQKHDWNDNCMKNNIKFFEIRDLSGNNAGMIEYPHIIVYFSLFPVEIEIYILV